MERSELSVLVLEDTEMVRNMLPKILSMAGVKKVDTAENEEEALEFLKTKKPYELFIFDTFSESGAYGPRVLKRARELGYENTKVIAMSSDNFAENLWQGESKADYFLRKPFGNVRELVDLVVKEFPEA